MKSALAELKGLHDTGIDWPSLDVVWRVLTMQDYNTRIVILSTLILGLASGLVGCFLLLRKRSLMGDALSHACLPGIGIAFIIMTALGMEGKSLPGLLAGATVTGVLGVVLVLIIRNTSRIKDDAAMGIILSVFFGLGTVVLTMIQDVPGASAAGLESFIYGKTASMGQQDAWLLGGVAAIALLCSLLLLKELTLLCFDEGFGRSQGWPINGLDVILLALVTLVTVVGLQAVGLILIIAFLITPAAAARFWTNDLRTMLILSAVIGGVSGWCGATFSALLPRLPAGAVIVLVAAMIFLVSMFFGSARGVVRRWVSMFRLKRKIGRQHLLRAVYEIQESQCLQESKEPLNVAIPFEQLLAHRTWSANDLRKLMRQAQHEDHLDQFDGQNVRLSESGFGEATRITRNHRLWEIFLITHADIAASHVDRDADSVEHILSPDMVRELEEKLDLLGIPESPHHIAQPEGGQA
ncbi:iron chelate uptake ABC transporter family permease subunit [Cerasicoccus frondis]|uniref:metal ABC transporter permease n=1 Tax=Cerasicoccus frondis TaxID=490090 RepID=UPI002852D102|nr:iron chelate uptake ABC transporter family permease subunit [Cerasicoccus frondis]